MLTKTSLTMMLAGALVAFGTPAALAQNHDEGRHGGGHNRGHEYSQGRGHSGNEHHEFRGGGGHYGGHEYNRGERFYGGRDYDHGRYYGRGWGFGFRSPYYGGGYYVAPNPCNPAGFYDQWGNWQWYPGCYAGPPAYYGPGY